MQVIAAVAIGLNPYIGAFVLTALAAFSNNVPSGALLGVTPMPVVTLIAALLGLAAPIDFVLGKFLRFAPAARRISQYVAPIAGGVAAAALTESQLPLPIVAVGAAILSWGVATMLTAVAARASRSAAWVGLGHVPVLMAAATAAACIVPLGLAKPVVGYVLSALTLSLLAGVSLLARQSSAARTRGAVQVARLSVR